MSVVIAVGTRKGLWVARSDAEGEWALAGPSLPMREVPALAFLPDPAGGVPELLAGVRSEHWGPTVARSADLGDTWQETEQAAVRFPAETGAALERIWQVQPDPARPDVVWAGCEPTSLWRSGDGGRELRRWSRACGSTRTGRAGSPAPAARPCTRSSRTRRTPTGCWSR